MRREIGNVVLDYTYYCGKDLYSDGEIEDILLEAVRNGNEEQLLHASSNWAVLYHLSSIRENLLEWYDFGKDAEILEIGSGCGAVTGILAKKAKSVTCVELSEKRSMINAYRHKEMDNIRILLGNFQDIELQEKYDCITLIGVWEYAAQYIGGENPYVEMLKKLKHHLKADGKIIIAIENKMGIKYLNGSPEDHTEKLYSGLRDYIGVTRVRTFSKPEIQSLFSEAGIENYQFYYPVPDYKLPICIYSDELQPAPAELRTYRSNYNTARVYHAYDAALNDQICSDKMFSYFSNSFLIVCGEEEVKHSYVKYNRERVADCRIKTQIENHESGRLVKKQALETCGSAHIERMADHNLNWHCTFPNLDVPQSKYEKNSFEMAYIEGESLEASLYPLRHRLNRFLEAIRRMIQEYFIPLQDQLRPFVKTEAFERVFGQNLEIPDTEQSLPVTNIDMLFSNMKKTKQGKVYCFDAEWVFDFPVPYQFVVWRALEIIYAKYAIYLRGNITKNQFFNEFGFHDSQIAVYGAMQQNFYLYVHGQHMREMYTKNYRKSVINEEISIQG